MGWTHSYNQKCRRAAATIITITTIIIIIIISIIANIGVFYVVLPAFYIKKAWCNIMKTKGGLVLASQKHLASLVQIVVIPQKAGILSQFYYVCVLFSLFFLIWYYYLVLMLHQKHLNLIIFLLNICMWSK